MTLLIRCDGKGCLGRYRSNATKRGKCPYCGHETKIRDAVVILDPKATAGYGEVSGFVKKTKQEFQRIERVE